MDTIKNLFYGNIHPFERDIKKDSESDRLAKLILRHDAALKATMNENEIELFGKFKDAVTELNCLNECEGFISGFRLGVIAHRRIKNRSPEKWGCNSFAVYSA